MKKKLFYNGNIISLNDNNDVYTEILIDKNIIADLSKDDRLQNEIMDDVVKIDLKGKTMIPGFFDSHLHFVEGGRSLIDLNLKNTKKFEDFKKELINFTFESDEDWILGNGWNEMDLFGGKMPDKNILDQIVLNKPVALTREDGHCILLNSKAISILKLEKSRDLKAPRFEDGSLTGMFYENESLSVINKIRKTLPKEYFKRAIKLASDAMVFNGITAINDILTDQPEKFFLYKKMLKKDEIKIRLFASPYGDSILSKIGFDLLKKYTDSKLKIGPDKYFLDGSMGSNTAYLSEPYENNPQNKGLLTMKKYKIKKAIKEAFKENKQLSFHAIGDEAVSVFLDLYEKEYDKYQMNIRTRLEHIEIIKPKDIKRLKKLKIIPSVQPVFNMEKDLILNRLGLNRIKDTHRFKTFVDLDVNVIFNSDWPFGGGEYPIRDDGYVFNGFEPLLGIHMAVNDENLNKDEQVDVYSALCAYTKNPAYANYMEDFYGSLEKGKFADLIILSQNIFEVPRSMIKDIKVDMTMIDGKIVHKR